MMAVLKTGAAYVPIDPAHEASRMEFVLADASPAAVITSADLRSRVDGRGLRVIDVADPALAAQPATALPAPSADNLAYMIYTSGTTGKPKGVAIAHYTVTWLVESLDAGLPPGRVWTNAIRRRSTSRCGRSSAPCCAVADCWWCPKRWPARRRTSTPCWSMKRSVS